MSNIHDYQQATFFALRETLGSAEVGQTFASHSPTAEIWRVFRDDPSQAERRERLWEQTGKRLVGHGHGVRVVAV